MTYRVVTIDALAGKTFTHVIKGHDTLTFEGAEKSFRFYHRQDCCEDVYIEDICGDLSDLENTPILLAEERTENDEGAEYGSGTWTFYEFLTEKGSVTVRWYGSSNGYYSETVDFCEL